MTDTKFSNGYALLIGVGGADIPVTVKDATGLHDVLVNPSRAAYPSGQVKLLTEAGADRKGILDGFDWLVQQVQGNPNATVIVYFSGHGIQVERQDRPTEYYLIPHGYDLSRLSESTISGLEFTNKIEVIKARKLVVFLDCCHANGIPVSKKPGEVAVKSIPLPPDLLNILDTGSGEVIVTSSREDEYSFTGTPYSAFTACLIEALKGKGAIDKDGFARIFNVLTYVTREVPLRTSKKQNPRLNEARNCDNFPLCYYAGGIKDIPDEMQNSVAVSSPAFVSIRLTSRERQDLEEELDMLLDLRKIPVEKLNRLRRALLIEMNPAIKFQLEKQIQDDEETLSRLKARIAEIDQKLQ